MEYPWWAPAEASEIRIKANTPSRCRRHLRQAAFHHVSICPRATGGKFSSHHSQPAARKVRAAAPSKSAGGNKSAKGTFSVNVVPDPVPAPLFTSQFHRQTNSSMERTTFQPHARCPAVRLHRHAVENRGDRHFAKVRVPSAGPRFRSKPGRTRSLAPLCLHAFVVRCRGPCLPSRGVKL